MTEGKISEKSIEYLKGLRFPIPVSNVYLNVQSGPGFGSTAYPVAIEEVAEPLKPDEKIRWVNKEEVHFGYVAGLINGEVGLIYLIGVGYQRIMFEESVERYDWNDKDLFEQFKKASEE